MLDDYITPRTGEQNISVECERAGSEYIRALGHCLYRELSLGRLSDKLGRMFHCSQTERFRSGRGLGLEEV